MLPEFRRDPVVGRWVIISTERGKRPDDFISQAKEPNKAGCPFCEGFELKTPPEIIAVRNPETKPNSPGWQVRVVENKFPALVKEGSTKKHRQGINRFIDGVGAHEVFIENPVHGIEIEDLPEFHIQLILQAYKDRLVELGRDERLRYILIFKNVGERAGASLSHAHSQLVALPMIPKRLREELCGAREHFLKEGSCVFCEMIKQEEDSRERLVVENEDFTAFCPYASRFPFEIWIMPRFHSPHFYRMKKNHLAAMAEILKQTLQKLTVSLNKPQYNYMLHTAPVRFNKKNYGATLEQDFHWHLEIIPRLTRVAGFEWGTGFYINPTPPEQAAAFLRSA